MPPTPQEQFDRDVNALAQKLTGDNEVSSGLEFGVAASIEEVLAAWQLVYETYHTAGLIDSNSHQIHCTDQAVNSDTAVFIGAIDSQIVSTATCIHDNGAGLPLDAEYKKELDAMRRDGRKLTEVGLLADRRSMLSRRIDSLLILMHYAYDYAFLDDGTDIIIGVHPRHARFYKRMFGFDICGSERSYATVKDHPVVLLQLKRTAQDTLDPLPRGLQYFIETPLPTNPFLHRFNPSLRQIAGSPIEQYLRDKYPDTMRLAS